MRFSALIPAYKSVDFIEECLDSVNNQTYFNQTDDYEILVGVDGCKPTLQKIKSVGGKYKNLVVFMMKKNKGVYITLNTLFSVMTGDGAIIFGSDDIMMPNMVDEISKYSETYDIIRYPSINFSGTTEIQIDGHIPSGAIYIKKTAFDKLGGFKPWICAADSDLNKRARLFPTKTMNDPLFYRRIHSESLTNNPLTGKGSDIRHNYKLQMSQKFEYVTPVINQYTKIIL